MADGVDASVHDVEPPALDPPLDRPPADAELDQLPPVDDAVLPRRQLRDEGVDGSRLRLTTYMGVNCRVDWHRPILALPSCRVARGSLQTCGALARQLRVGEDAVGRVGRSQRAQAVVREVRDRSDGEQLVEVRVAGVVSEERAERACLPSLDAAVRARR